MREKKQLYGSCGSQLCLSFRNGMLLFLFRPLLKSSNFVYLLFPEKNNKKSTKVCKPDTQSVCTPSYLAMLQRGSMRWTVGSSMYSKARFPGALAQSTLRLTCTGPAPVTEGAEKHTISDMLLLVGVPEEEFMLLTPIELPL